MKRYLVPCLLFMALAILPLHARAAQNGLSTHILDINLGKPAAGVSITCYALDPATENWTQISTHVTDDNGRVSSVLPAGKSQAGVYKLRFATAGYFQQLNQSSIYPFIEVVFRMEDQGHYHIPITLSANGYSTYRGN